MCIGYTKYVAPISNHVKIGSITCLFWLPLLENRGSQNSSEQSCDSLLFDSISVPKIRSTPNSKWSSLQDSWSISLRAGFMEIKTGGRRKVHEWNLNCRGLFIFFYFLLLSFFLFNILRLYITSNVHNLVYIASYKSPRRR